MVDHEHEMGHLTTLWDELDPNIELQIYHCQCGHIIAWRIYEERKTEVSLYPEEKIALEEIRGLFCRILQEED